MSPGKPTRLVGRADKNAVTAACVKFICHDIRPFNSVSGEGFQGLVQVLLDMQHRSSEPLSASDLLPHPTTVSRAVHDRAVTVRGQLQVSLNDALSRGRVSFTSDIWTDDYKKISYLSITAHWISTEWELESRVLCTNEFDATKKKTGNNVRHAIVDVLDTLEIDEATAGSVVFTTGTVEINKVP